MKARDGGTIGEVVRTDNGLLVRDDTGRYVDEEDLEQRIILLRGSVEEIEPLVAHFDDLPATVRRMRDGGLDGVKSELGELLDRMAGHNEEITREARADPHYGFTRSAIREDIPHATVDRSKYALGGVHLLAHQQLGEFFRGSTFYPLGIDAVFDSELGRRALSGALLFVGLVLISVACPVAGIVLGVEVAAIGVAEAYDKAHVYDALVDPTQVLTKAEVELELFAAWIGLALSFLPVAGKLAGALGKAGSAAAAAGGEAVAAGVAGGEVAAGQAGRTAAAAGEEALALEGAAAGTEAARALVGTAEKELVEHFITELLKAEALNRALEFVLEPIMRRMQHELESTAAVGGLHRAVALVLQRQRRTGKGH